MRQRISNIYRLGIKELFSLRYDLFLVFLIVYFLTFGVYESSRSGGTDVLNAVFQTSRSHFGRGD